MTVPSHPLRMLDDLKPLTPARVALGRVGAGLPTRALLDFTLDHARARDAVHATFDAAALARDLEGMGLVALTVCSQAADRRDYLKRPDLGRLLAPESEALLAQRRQPSCDVVLVVGDGLSPAAVTVHAAGLLRKLLPRLQDAGIGVGAAVVASGARVALGDGIGALLNARMVILLIGERPGLSAPHSLGAYLTFAPAPGRTDAERNCVSNIHGDGLSYDEAAVRIAWLACAGLGRGVTGVALKDDSGMQPLQVAP